MTEQVKTAEQAKKKANRVKSTEAISGIMSAFYERMFDEGSKVCWCVAPVRTKCSAP